MHNPVCISGLQQSAFIVEHLGNLHIDGDRFLSLSFCEHLSLLAVKMNYMHGKQWWCVCVLYVPESFWGW